MLDDLTKEIKAQLYDRARSPLFGAFALSWVAWNYRVLLALLTLPEFDKKLAFIDKEYPGAWDIVLHGALGPLVSAVLFLWLYPYPARWAYTYWANQQKKLKEAQQRIEDEMPMTNEEAKALRKAALEQEAALQGQLKEMADSNKELRERYRLLQEENQRLAIERAQFEEAAKMAETQQAPALAATLANSPTTEANGISQSLQTMRAAPLTIDAVLAAQKDRLTKQVNISTAAQRVFVSLVHLDGTGELKEITKDTGLRKLEVLDGLDILRQGQYTEELTPELYGLTSKGRALAVSLGLPEIFRQGLPPGTEDPPRTPPTPSKRSVDVSFSVS